MLIFLHNFFLSHWLLINILFCIKICVKWALHGQDVLFLVSKPSSFKRLFIDVLILCHLQNLILSESNKGTFCLLSSIVFLRCLLTPIFYAHVTFNFFCFYISTVICISLYFNQMFFPVILICSVNFCSYFNNILSHLKVFYMFFPIKDLSFLKIFIQINSL